MLIHTGTVELYTDRLLLRKFKYSDVRDMLKNWISDPAVQLNYGEPVYESQEAVEELLSRWIPQYKDKAFYRWSIIDNKTGENMGQIAFCRVYNEFETAEVEYCLGRNFRRKGIVPEALRAIIKYSFEKPQFSKLEAFHRITNPNSGRVLEKSGMSIVANIKRFESLGEEPSGEICYAMTKQEYVNTEHMSYNE